MRNRRIRLSNGGYAIVSACDYERCAARSWYKTQSKTSRTPYAVSSNGGSVAPIGLHRFILEPAKGEDVDHVDGNGLNNTRSNIRKCSRKENARNQQKQQVETTSRFKGVFLDRLRWRALIKQDGNKLYLGSFRSEFAAAKQYDRAARIFFGKFAKTNAMLGLFDGAVDHVLPA